MEEDILKMDRNTISSFYKEENKNYEKDSLNYQSHQKVIFYFF